MTGTEPAVLERERIERMRAQVMGTIERDTSARRTRRSWIAVGGVAAAAVVVVGGAVGAGLNGGLMSGSDSMSAGGSSAERAAVEDSGASRAADDVATEEDQAPAETVITTGSMSARVDDIDETAFAIRAFAAGLGGRIDGESLEAGRYPSGELTVRIPAQRLDALRDLVEEAGEVRSMNVNREDVATQVADVDARIASLETSIRRLRAIISESSTTRELLDAEAQLTQRQSDLEALQAQRRVLRDQTGLATIYVSLSPTEAAKSVEPGGFVGGLTQGWNALVATTNALVTAAGVAVPWLLPLALLGGLAALARHRWRRRP
ncbi:DUF4349 domain-containing protein [Aeromicrobium sp.]|uniref:DUF4349 domain-containing protein n=1 Tax=Aeromicrobium sp. TaxID=1871063 RepID=UPI0028B0DD04|nr:DUF4349 domain-containing protein [Aeromicrobium sp.]